MIELTYFIQKRIIEIYNSENIKMLSGLQNNYVLKNGKQLLIWNSETIFNIHKLEIENEINLNITNFIFHKNLENILFTSDEIAYFTANCFLYKDFINNPINDVLISFNKEKKITYYPNRQNLSSKRYSMFVAIVFEKLYNYWDRLGDLLWATYFQNELKEKSVDFYKIIEIIKRNHPKYSSFDSFKWLLNFRDNNYKSLNEIRKNIVHYSSIDIEFKFKHLDTFKNNEGNSQKIQSDKNEVEKIMIERYGYFNFLKDEIENTLEGFIKIHELIEEITLSKVNENKIN